MTEEIIIDGVNVAECGAYKDKHCKDKTSIIFCDTNLCSNYPYCYFKQLKRLEQENKELKVVKEQLKKWNDENLKRQDNMQLWIDLAEEQRKNYRSALEEIRSYCKSCENGVNARKIKEYINEVLNLS